MDPVPTCFVSGSFGRMLRLARFAGVAPLSFVRLKTGWRVSVSPALTICGYCCITINILITVGSLIGELSVAQTDAVRMRTGTRRVVWMMDSLLMTTVASASVYGAPTHMRSMIACLNHLQKINTELHIHEWPASAREDRKSFVIISWAVATTVLLCCVDHGLSFYTLNQSDAAKWIVQMYVFYYFYYWTKQMQELLFVMLTQHVVYSFRAANNSLRHVLDETAHAGINLYMRKPKTGLRKGDKKLFSNKVKSTAASKKTISEFTNQHPYHETIHSVARAYVSTCDVVREVNRCHGLLVLLMLASFLLHLVVTLYYLTTNMIEHSKSASSSMPIVSVVVQLLWCLYHAANLVILIEPSHASHTEMEVTRELVSHLMQCTYSVFDPLALELELFSRHLVLNQVSYSPMKVTTLTRSLVITILASITTYLAVLVKL